MKRSLGLWISLLFFFSLSTFYLAPATAATLPPKCNKVKVQVKTFEKAEKIFSTQYAPVNGKWSWFFTNAHLSGYWLLQKKIVAYEVKLFTFANSNLPCFTIVQQEYIASEFQEWKDIQGFLSAQPDWIAGIAFVPIEWDSIYDR